MRLRVVWPMLSLTLIGVSGNRTLGAQEPGPQVIHPPMPVPEMTVPVEHRVTPTPTALAPAAPDPDLPAPLAPSPAAGFPGLGDNVCSFAMGCTIPPDTHGAAGPNHLMEVLNTEVWVQDKTGTLVLSGPFLLNDWWAPANPNLDGAFDPRVHYDPFADRWISVVCDESPRTDPALSGVLIGVSDTGDPTGTWSMTRIDADPGDSLWADYPNVGFNSKWVVLQVNLYTPGGSFDSSRIVVFDKAALYGGSFVPVADWNVSGHGGTHVPAVVYDPAEPDLHLLQRVNGDVGGVGYLRLYTITGPTATPTLVGLDPSPMYVTTGPGEGWEGASAPTPPYPDFAPQINDAAPSNCANCPAAPFCRIQTNDDRIQNVVQRNGKLWAAHTVFLPLGGPARSSVQWWQIDPVTTGVLQRGLVDDPLGARFFAFPSIAVNKHEDVLLGYSSFEDSQYASASYSFRTFFDPPGTMQSEEVTQLGAACYFKDLAGGRNRWGDYSATIVDPDDTRLWTLQEYAELPDLGEIIADRRDKWGTWWSMVDTTRTVTINDVARAEGHSGTTAFVFTVTLSEPTPLTVIVDWETSDGTATVGDGDYVPVVGGQVTFSPGETTKNVTVDVNGDLVWEPDESFFVDLSNPVNANLADIQGEGTIQNDDGVPQVSISDVQKIEGNAGFETTDFDFRITLSNPSSLQVDLDWTTTDGSAVQGPANDYTGDSNTTIFLPGTVSQGVTIKVHGDPNPEPDEVFTVDLTGGANATIIKSQGFGRIIDDDASTPGVEALSAIAGGGAAAASGTTLLQWLTPTGAGGGVFRVEANASAGAGGNCTPPGAPGAGTPLAPLPAVAPGTTQSLDVTTTGFVLNPGFEYCYSVWIGYPGPPYSPIATVNARPYDATGPLKWKLFSKATALAQPTVGLDAVVAPSNDLMLHSMARGAAGGPWPAPWLPVHLGAISQHRAPIVPVGGVSRAYVATQDGRVHCIDTMNGALLWSTQLPEGAAQGAPAGMFTAWGGDFDYLFVGTSAGGGDRMYALDPFTGAVIDAFPSAAEMGTIGGNVGAINSMASVHYGANRLYFTSWQGTSNGTVWGLQIGPSSDALQLAWKFDGPNNVNGSPVLHNDRVYVGDAVDTVWSHPAATGTPGEYGLALGDGPPKGFLFPDRRNDNLYVATNGKVWAVRDTGAALVTVWPTEPSLNNPSVVLHHPGTDDVYVGVQDRLGRAAVVRLDATDGTIASSVDLETAPLTIGPPSLDIGFGMLHVGSVAGILYAVELPF